jgi:hypothetical protein
MYGKVICLSCLIAAGVVSVPRGCAAADVSPNETKAVSGTTGGARPELAGVVLRDELIDFEIRNAAGQVVFAGKVQDRVARSDQLKTLSFVFRIRDTKPGLPGRITEVRREGFGGWQTDMDYALDGLGTIGPDSVNRDPKRAAVGFSFGKLLKGAAVGFSFGKSPITPGAESRFCFVLTDATSFDAKATSLVIIADDGSKVTLRVAAPKK